MSILKVNQIQTANGVIMANLNSSGENIGFQLASTLAPAFSAYQSSAQTLSTSTTTKIQFQTEEWDTASCFNNTGSTVGSIPAYAFLPNVAGYYQVTGGIQVGTSATVMTMYLYKNGSAYKQLVSSNSATLSGGYGGALVYLNGSTDYIEFYVNLSTGQILNAQSYYCYFQAAMIRSA